MLTEPCLRRQRGSQSVMGAWQGCGQCLGFTVTRWHRCFLPLFRHSRRKNRTVAEETWIQDLMNDVTTDILAEYAMLWLVIDDLNFDPADQRVDEIVWTRMASGQYSARSAYLMQFQGSLKSDFKKLLIWQVWASSRCKFFVWLML
jgi:hypothetical protein